MQSDASKELPIFHPTFIIFASSRPDICAKSEGFSETEPDELSVEIDELSIEIDELSEELEFSVELEELVFSVAEESEFPVEPTFSVTEELEFPVEFSITAPFEQPERQQTATAAAIIKRIFLFKSNTSYLIIWNYFTIFRTICQWKS